MSHPVLARPQPAGREGQGIAQGREGSALRSGEQHLRCKTVHIHHCLKAKPTSSAPVASGRQRRAEERKGEERRERWSEKMATVAAALKMVSREECNQNP